MLSGLSRDAVQPCVDWMAPYVESVNWFGRAPLKDFAGIKEENRHDVQMHTNYMSMLVGIFLFGYTEGILFLIGQTH